MDCLEDFETIIRRNNNRITAAIPQLGLYSTADDMVTALDGLERKKEAFLNDLREAGEIDDLETIPKTATAGDIRIRSDFTSTDRPPSARPTFLRETMQFTVKLAIVVVLFVAAAIATTNYVINKAAALAEKTQVALQTSIERLQTTANTEARQYTGGAFWAKIEAGIHDMADPKHELPDERKQKVLTSLRTIKERWWPFIEATLSPPAEANRVDPSTQQP
jgi:hypothetical protein